MIRWKSGSFDAPFIALLRSLAIKYSTSCMVANYPYRRILSPRPALTDWKANSRSKTKAGDINRQAWDAARGQIDLLRTDAAAHPSFDSTLPRKAVFVTTGRFVGGAPIAAQNYRNHLASLGEITFTTWKKQDLIQLISSDPRVLLASDAQGAFLTLLGQIDEGKTSDPDIEGYSRRWLSSPKSVYQLTIEAAVIAQRLRIAKRLDLACLTALSLLRATWTRSHANGPAGSGAQLVADAAVQMFRQYAWDLFARCGEDMLDPIGFLRQHGSIASHVSYPVLCLRTVEFLGLLYLLDAPEDGPRKGELGEIHCLVYRGESRRRSPDFRSMGSFFNSRSADRRPAWGDADHPRPAARCDKVGRGSIRLKQPWSCAGGFLTA